MEERCWTGAWKKSHPWMGAWYSRQDRFRAFSANSTHSIHLSVAPLLAGQEDTDISSLLETTETRCSHKSDLSGKSGTEEGAWREQGGSPAALARA